MRTDAQIRTTGLIFYAILLSGIQFWIIGTAFRPDEHSIWLFNGIASLLFGSRLLNPHFTPPADAATNGFVAFASLVAGSLAIEATSDMIVLWGTAAVCALVTLLALAVLVLRPAMGIEWPRWLRIAERAARTVGSPNVIFTIVILSAVWLFHRTKALEVFSILSAWTAIISLHPAESIISFFEWIRSQPRAINANAIVGTIAAHQSPGIVLIRQSTEAALERGAALLVAERHGPLMLGVALNYVGRDEGNLLRALVVPLPAQLQAQVDQPIFQGDFGIAMHLDLPDEDRDQFPAFEWINRLCGIVDSDTSLEFLQFEVIEDRDFAQGRLVEVRIGDDRQVLHQIIDGLTREDIVQQKNKYGYRNSETIPNSAEFALPVYHPPHAPP